MIRCHGSQHKAYSVQQSPQGSLGNDSEELRSLKPKPKLQTSSKIETNSSSIDFVFAFGLCQAHSFMEKERMKADCKDDSTEVTFVNCKACVV